MKKNKYLYIVLAFFLAGGIASCSLIDKDPVSEIAPDNFFNNSKDATAYMAGIYNSLQTTLRSNYFDWGEVRSDNVLNAGTGTAQEKLLNNVLAGNDNDLNAITNWSNLYRSISLCNYAIEKFPDLIARNVDASEAQYKDQLGQAYALRGLLYFYALRVWGGTPIVNDVITNVNQQLSYPRATVAEMKTQILSDIDNALLTIGTSTTSKYYIQRGGVFALKTDVHMWFQEYPEAIQASNNLTGYSYITAPSQWKQIFTAPEGSTETIFNMFWNSVEAGNQGVAVCQKLGSSGNTSQYRIAPTVVEPYYNRFNVGTTKKSDARLWLSIDTVLYPTVDAFASAAGNIIQYGKFMDVSPVTGGFAYVTNQECSVKVPIYRYADVMLLRAEALARTYSFQQSLNIVNAIRSRVGYNVQAVLSDYTGSQEEIAIAIQKTVLQERQLELIGEGKRWFDLCRIGKTYDYTLNGYDYLRAVMNPILIARGSEAVPYNSDLNMGRVLYPINSDVINANPLLRGKQNPPYSE